MVTTSQKPVIDMQRIKRKVSKYITKENQQTMKEKKRSEKNYKHKHKTSNKIFQSISRNNVNFG